MKTGAVLHILGIPTIVNREAFIANLEGLYVFFGAEAGFIMLVEKIPDNPGRYVCSLDNDGATKVLDVLQIALILDQYKAEKFAELSELPLPEAEV